MEKSGRKKYIQGGMEEAPENGRLVAFCTCQWNRIAYIKMHQESQHTDWHCEVLLVTPGFDV
jgi:hypothetical protein